MTSMVAVRAILCRRAELPTASLLQSSSMPLSDPIVRRFPALVVVATAISALCPSRRVENDSSNFVFPRFDHQSPGSQTDIPKNEFFFVDSLIKFLWSGSRHGPRSRNMFAHFSRVSPVWKRRRGEESCGSLAQAQASARVDVPTARFFTSTDPGDRHVCTGFFSRECVDMCTTDNRP